jgi:hypothetical protein
MLVETKYFKDLATGEYFYFDGRNYKKNSFETGKDVYSYYTKEFYPMDEVQVDKKNKFQLNY